MDSVAGIKFLDNYLASRGYEVVYTSAMGGKHAKGSGHYNGAKIDVQVFKNGKPAKLTPEEEKYVYYSLGFKGDGAVGWEAVPGQVGGGHYDLNSLRASMIINKYKG